MSFFSVFGKMMEILVTMLAGILCHKLGYLGGEIDQKLSKLILNITMPAMIVGAVINSDSMGGLAEILEILKVSVIFYGLAFLFVAVVPRFLGGTPAQKGVWRYSLSFSNVGFIGYPVAVALYGPGALFYAAILALPFNVMSFSLGPLMLAGRSRFKWRYLFSPCVVASLIALACALFGFRPPTAIGEMAEFLGSATVPLSLLVLGSLLAGLPAKQVLTSPRIWVLTVLRLIVMPVILFYCLKPMGLIPEILGIAVTQMAMPVAVNGTLLSIEYGGDTEAMAQVTFLSTVASMVTIPLIATIFL